QSSVPQQGRCSGPQGRENIAVQSSRRPVKSQTQMPVRIAVTNEVPAVGRARLQDSVHQRLNYVAQKLVQSCRSGVQLDVKPLRTGRKSTRRREAGVLYVSQRLFVLQLCSLGGRSANKRNYQFMHVVPFGAARQELIWAGEQLDQRRLFASLDQLHEGI